MREGKPHWVFVGMAGHEEEEGRAIDEALLNRVEMPRQFYRDLNAVIGPGTTVLVTNSRVGAGTWDHLTVIEAIHPHAVPEGG